MPFVFLILAVGLIVVAINGTQSQAFQLLKSEFVGTNSFAVWVAAIAILGALAYIKPIRPVAVSFIVLVLLVMVLNNKGGFFSQFNRQLANPTPPDGSSGAALTGLFGGQSIGSIQAGGGGSLLTQPNTPAGAGAGSTLFPWLNPQEYEQYSPGYAPAA